MSLDGFVAGPAQSVENPLGIGGMRLHEWVFPLAAWRSMHGLAGGEVNESTPVVEESLANIGATVMGRHMFGGPPGAWVRREPWNGWWGTQPAVSSPGIRPHTSSTQAARARRRNELHVRHRGHRGGARTGAAGAGDQDVSLAGGANVARQYLAAGLVDEMEIHLVPTLLGSGERLFDGRRRSARARAGANGRHPTGDAPQVLAAPVRLKPDTTYEFSIR